MPEATRSPTHIVRGELKGGFEDWKNAKKSEWKNGEAPTEDEGGRTDRTCAVAIVMEHRSMTRATSRRRRTGAASERTESEYASRTCRRVEVQSSSNSSSDGRVGAEHSRLDGEDTSELGCALVDSPNRSENFPSHRH